MSRASLRTASPFVLATILAVGFGLAWSTAWVFLGLSLLRAGRPPSPYRQLVITQSGQALWQTTTYSPSYHLSFETLDGDHVAAESMKLDSIVSLNGNGVLEAKARLGGHSLSWHNRILRFNDVDKPSPLIWYLVHDGQPYGHAHFVAYDPKANTRLGYIGLHGFSPVAPAVNQSFAIDGNRFGSRTVATFSPHFYPEFWGGYFPINEQVYLLSDGVLYRVDLRRRDVEKVELPGPIVSMARVTDAKSIDVYGQANQSLIAVRLRGQIVLLARDGETRKLPIPAELQDVSFRADVTKGEEVVLITQWNGWKDLERREYANTIYWLDANGEITRRREVMQVASAPLEKDGVFYPVVLQSALAGPTIVAASLYLEVGQSFTTAEAVGEFGKALVDAWPSIAIGLALGAVLAVVAYRHARRNDLAHPAAWAAFVLVGGVPGLVGYLVHRRWPPREPCVHCGQPTPRNRLACVECRQEFAPPALTGVEIFA